jgi:DNA-binding NarL/FixJ family response regulator
MFTPESIKIVVLHEDPVAVAGLSATFRKYPDFRVDEAVGAPATALELSSADVVVADFANGMRAATLLKALQRSTNTKIVIYAGLDREWQVRRAVQAGVRGYIVVGTAIEGLAAGVRAVHAGARHYCPQAAARLAESLTVEELTGREEEVLRLVVSGLCNKEVGRRLGIAVGTVKSHLKSTFDKLNVQSRTQAVAAVERRGLLWQPNEARSHVMSEPWQAAHHGFQGSRGVAGHSSAAYT